MPSPHFCSLYSVYLEILCANKIDGTEIVLSNATGCLYKYREKCYLITSWHVLSGKNSITGKSLNSYLATPEFIRVHFPVDGNVTEEIVRTYELVATDGGFNWIEHSKSGAIDVAALEIEIPEGIATFDIAEATKVPGLGQKDEFFYVTKEVWVIGFPKGIRRGGLPIWKRATIASESSSEKGFSESRTILDTATREGMSGSPVLYVNSNLSRLSFDNRKQEVLFPSVKLLLGIYSGRIAGDDELAAQLGIVWNSDCIPEIISLNLKYECRST